MVDVVRLFERLHGHVGWLAVAALVHPALLLRRRRRADLAVGLAVLIATVVGAAGALLYVPYRARIKPLLFQSEPAVGWMFERKEHLAFGAIALAWCGALAYVASRATEDDGEALRRAARRAFACAALLAAGAGVLGTWVATVRSL